MGEREIHDLLSDTEEEVMGYGNLLPDLTLDDFPRKKSYTENQFAKDKQDRRRFHGAFTGGFSAGYCNTVGSQEGWAPSSFKSSRTEKSKRYEQKPEDFMDEEDTDDFGIAPNVLKTTEDYSCRPTKEKLKRSHIYEHMGTIPGEPVLKGFLEPVRITIGMKLLMAMGWKPGQGIGPRLIAKQKKEMSKQLTEIGKKVYGCSLPSAADRERDSESEDGEDEILLAPLDYESLIAEPKDDFFGIGYKGLNKRNVLSSSSSGTSKFSLLKMRDKNREVLISGQAFGVGILEEDDDDIYASEDMTQYDISLGGRASKWEAQTSSCNTLKKDSKICLKGFVSASNKMETKFFSPPTVPFDFTPKVFKQRFESSREINKICHFDIKYRAACLDDNSSKQSANDCNKTFEEETNRKKDKETGVEISEEDISNKNAKILNSRTDIVTEWERNLEKFNFEKANPSINSLLMNDRFISAGYDDAVEKVEQLKSEPNKIKIKPQVYRTVEDWLPEKLLCKRFNIPEPNMEKVPTVQGKQKITALFSNFDFSTILPPPVKKVDEIPDSLILNSSVDKIIDENSTNPIIEIDGAKENISTADEVDEKLSGLQKVDLYKSIFLSSSEESDTESENDEKDDSKLKEISTTNLLQQNKSDELQERLEHHSVMEVMTSESSSKSSPKMSRDSKLLEPRKDDNSECCDKLPAPSGIFANLDFDVLVKHKEIPEQKEIQCVEVIEEQKIDDSYCQEIEAYGPSLPPILKGRDSDPQKTKENFQRFTEHKQQVTEKYKWVEKKHSKKSKHKKEHKHHHKDKKRKEHKKKHRSH